MEDKLFLTKPKTLEYLRPKVLEVDGPTDIEDLFTKAGIQSGDVGSFSDAYVMNAAAGIFPKEKTAGFVHLQSATPTTKQIEWYDFNSKSVYRRVKIQGTWKDWEKVALQGIEAAYEDREPQLVESEIRQLYYTDISGELGVKDITSGGYSATEDLESLKIKTIGVYGGNGDLKTAWGALETSVYVDRGASDIRIKLIQTFEVIYAPANSKAEKYLNKVLRRHSDWWRTASGTTLEDALKIKTNWDNFVFQDWEEIALVEYTPFQYKGAFGVGKTKEEVWEACPEDKTSFIRCNFTNSEGPEGVSGGGMLLTVQKWGSTIGAVTAYDINYSSKGPWINYRYGTNSWSGWVEMNPVEKQTHTSCSRPSCFAKLKADNDVTFIRGAFLETESPTESSTDYFFIEIYRSDSTNGYVKATSVDDKGVYISWTNGSDPTSTSNWLPWRQIADTGILLTQGASNITDLDTFIDDTIGDEDVKASFVKATFEEQVAPVDGYNNLGLISYIYNMPHSSGVPRRKIISTRETTNELFVNTKTGGNWLGWEKLLGDKMKNVITTDAPMVTDLDSFVNSVIGKTNSKNYYKIGFALCSYSKTVGPLPATDDLYCYNIVINGDRNGRRKIIAFRATTDDMFINTKANSSSEWVGWKKVSMSTPS